MDFFLSGQTGLGKCTCRACPIAVPELAGVSRAALGKNRGRNNFLARFARITQRNQSSIIYVPRASSKEHANLS